MKSLHEFVRHDPVQSKIRLKNNLSVDNNVCRIINAFILVLRIST